MQLTVKTGKLWGLALARAGLGMSQSQLARELGVSKSMIGMVECGKRTLPAIPMIKLGQLELKLRQQSSLVSERDQAVKKMQEQPAGTKLLLVEISMNQ